MRSREFASSSGLAAPARRGALPLALACILLLAACGQPSSVIAGKTALTVTPTSVPPGVSATETAIAGRHETPNRPRVHSDLSSVGA